MRHLQMFARVLLQRRSLWVVAGLVLFVGVGAVLLPTAGQPQPGLSWSQALDEVAHPPAGTFIDPHWQHAVEAVLQTRLVQDQPLESGAAFVGSTQDALTVLDEAVQLVALWLGAACIAGERGQGTWRTLASATGGSGRTVWRKGLVCWLFAITLFLVSWAVDAGVRSLRYPSGDASTQLLLLDKAGIPTGKMLSMVRYALMGAALSVLGITLALFVGLTFSAWTRKASRALTFSLLWWVGGTLLLAGFSGVPAAHPWAQGLFWAYLAPGSVLPVDVALLRNSNWMVARASFGQVGMVLGGWGIGFLLALGAGLYRRPG
ncbi:MAG: hypothetical protein IMW91_09160 [Firmicutes bacterium]|nr:hypothetical protein [Bacillota bacterium]